jgi:type I restriction enzyme M protein
VRERSFLDTYALSKGRDKVERDVLFIERCLDLLRPGGRMAMVLPHNKFAAESYSHVREHILQRGRILAVVGLGRNTFLPHTHQKASILFLQKHAQRVTAMDDTSPIFFAISEKEGKNSRGQPVFKPDRRPSQAPDPWSDMDHDLDEILSQYQASRGV